MVSLRDGSRERVIVYGSTPSETADFLTKHEREALVSERRTVCEFLEEFGDRVTADVHLRRPFVVREEPLVDRIRGERRKESSGARQSPKRPLCDPRPSHRQRSRDPRAVRAVMTRRSTSPIHGGTFVASSLTDDASKS